MNWAEGTKEKRDSLIATYPDRVFGKVHVSRSIDFVTDGIAWGGNITDVKDLGWSMWMDHQCDEFDIGGVEDARQLISDLQAAIDYCSSFDEPKETGE